MFATTWLEWWHKGEWHEIGWRAFDPQSLRDLEEHAELLVAYKPGQYRLVRPSVYADSPPTVVREYEQARA